jgi:ribosomal protein L1
MAIGKASFSDDKLLDNYSAVIDEIDTGKAVDRELVGATAGDSASE